MAAADQGRGATERSVPGRPRDAKPTATVTQDRPASPPTARLPKPPRTRPPRESADSAAAPRQRRTVQIRRIDPWTVLKLSVVFNFVFLLFFMLIVTLLWTLIEQTGTVEQILEVLRQAGVAVDLRTGPIGRALFLVGLLAVVASAGANVFFCFLYNLVADLAGGLRVTLEDDG